MESNQSIQTTPNFPVYAINDGNNDMNVADFIGNFGPENLNYTQNNLGHLLDISLPVPALVKSSGLQRNYYASPTDAKELEDLVASWDLPELFQFFEGTHSVNIFVCSFYTYICINLSSLCRPTTLRRCVEALTGTNVREIIRTVVVFAWHTSRILSQMVSVENNK